MQIFDTRHWLALLLLPLVLVGCTGGSTSDDRGRTPPSVTLNVQGQYTRKVLGPNGFTSLETRPTRYAYAEVLRSSDYSYLSDTVLDANGRGLVDVPQGEKVFLVVYAQVAVPASDGSYFMQGSVKGIKRSDGTIPVRKQVYPGGINEFNGIPNWYYDSGDAIANAGTTLSMVSSVDDAASGAFNIADQMVNLAKGVERLSPATQLPNLHAWWSSKTTDASYPKVAEYQEGQSLYVLAQKSGRFVFQFDVRNNPSDVDPKAPAFNDSALQESMTRLLFADFSDQAVKPDATGFVPSILRRDNDNVSISRGFATESTAAFVAGASDFLSSAFRGSSVMYDVRPDGSVRTFDLGFHNPYNRSTFDGEFYRDGICLSLQGIWKNVLGGGDSGLRTIWSVMRGSNLAMAYPNAPLGCYPTFLVGLRNAQGVNWNGVLNELAQEKIQDVTTVNYLNSTALWIQTSVPAANLTGSLHTYNPNEDNIYYDRDQSQAYRFTQNWLGNRTFTVVPTGGQDCFLELIGPGGVVTGSYSSQQAGLTRSFTVKNLPAGDYVVRVRVGYTTATGHATYSLRVD